ncbi:MAG: sirohydrochlorin cobaltochelatase [Kiritimatiellaeota bacterium]|nr:sirohydrochlorin cobaltochelatase [Kiritimatiellota bacterium]
MKIGLLLVAQGGGGAGAQAILKRLEARARRRFPGMEIRWAYASERVRRQLAAQGQPVAAPADALAALRREGFTRVAVASLHVVAGREYDRLREAAAALRYGRRPLGEVVVSRPLLGSADDLRRVVRALLAAVPAARRKNEAVIFMGHGHADHPGALAYLAAAAACQRLDRLAFLATLESEPRLRAVLPLCRAAGVRKAYLLPFMALAGYHVRTDMAGKRKNSWARILAGAGIAPVVVDRGMFEYPAVVTLWLQHVAAALQGLRAAAPRTLAEAAGRRVRPQSHGGPVGAQSCCAHGRSKTAPLPG